MANNTLLRTFLAASILISGTGTFVSMMPQAQAITSIDELSDVDREDWAYDALMDLVEKYNVIEGYPDRTFKGPQAASRYELAAALNALIRQVGRDIARLGAEKADKKDLAMIAKLQEEFKVELKAVQARIAALEERAAKIEAKNEEQDTRLTHLEKLKIHGDVVVGGFADIGGRGANGTPFAGQGSTLPLVNVPPVGNINNTVINLAAPTQEGLSDSISAIGRVRINFDYPVVENEDGEGAIGEGMLHTRVVGAYGRVSPMLSPLDSNRPTTGAGMLSGASRIAADASARNEGIRTSNIQGVNPIGGNPTTTGVVSGSNTRANLYVESAYYTQKFNGGIPFVTDFLPGTNVFPTDDDWGTSFTLSAGLIPWREVFQTSPYTGDETQQFQNTALVNNAAIPVNTVSPMVTMEWHQGLGQWTSMDVKTGISAIDVSDAAGTFGVTGEGKLNYNLGWITDWLDHPGNVYAGGFYIHGRGGSNSLVTTTTGMRSTNTIVPVTALGGPNAPFTFNGTTIAYPIGTTYDDIKDLPDPFNFVGAVRFADIVADDNDNAYGLYAGMSQEIYRGAGAFFSYSVLDTGIQSTLMSALQNGTGRNVLLNKRAGGTLSRRGLNNLSLYGVKQSINGGLEIPMKALHLPWRHEDVFGLGYAMVTPNDAFQTSYAGAIPSLNAAQVQGYTIPELIAILSAAPLRSGANVISPIDGAPQPSGTLPSLLNNWGSTKIDRVLRELLEAQGLPGLTNDQSSEHILEAYYKVQVNDRFSITPSVQFIINRLGDSANDLNTVIGLRSTFMF